MLALAILLAGILAGAIAAIVTLSVWLHRSYEDRATLQIDLVAEQRRADDLQDQRDAAVAKADTMTSAAAELTRRLEHAETDRNAAITKEAEHVGETIRSAPDGMSALDALNRELQSPLSGAAEANPAAAGHGDRAADPVQPAGAAEGPDAGRRP